jgi:ElaB/YqjD/DUF883 family membrane-anchored ribosome-binding protein
MEKEPSKLISEEILPKEERESPHVLNDPYTLFQALQAAELQAKGFREELGISFKILKSWQEDNLVLKKANEKLLKLTKSYEENLNKKESELKEMKELYDKVLEEKKELGKKIEELREGRSETFLNYKKALEESSSVNKQLLEDNRRLRETVKCAEDFIDKSPCDPDTTTGQLEAWNRWITAKINLENKNV